MQHIKGEIDRKAFLAGLAIISAAYLFSPFRPPSVDGLAGPPTIASELWNYAWLIPLAAVVVKRVMDIGWPSWLGYALVAIVGLSFIPWSIGALPVRHGVMSAAASFGIKALMLIELLGFGACALVPGNWRSSRIGEHAFLRTANVASAASGTQEASAKTSAKLIWGLFIGSAVSFGLGAVAGFVIAVLRRRDLEGTPFASHGLTAIKVFTYSLAAVLVVGGVCVPLLMKFHPFAASGETHAIDAGVLMFMLGVVLVWLPGWGIVGLMRASKEQPFGS